MDKIENYRVKIIDLLNEYATHKPAYGDIEVEKIFDTQHNHYQLINIGWNKERRIYSPSIQIDIKNDKVWIQCNNTEADIAQELIDMGIPKQDIVIAFHSPSMRKYTDFALG